MKILLLALTLTTHAMATRFESPGAVAHDAQLSDRRLLTSSQSSATIETEIRNQLRYLVGQTFGNGSPALEHSLQIQLRGSRLLANGRREVRYAAKFLVAWEKASPPTQLSAVFPSGGDSSSLSRFDNAYKGKCGDPDSPLWYGLWFTQSGSCPLSSPTAPRYAVRLSLSLSLSASNSQGKSPEYEKIWEDGKLVVTFVAGNQDSRRGTQGEDLVVRLKQFLGEPGTYQKTSHGAYVTHVAEYDSEYGKVRVQAIDVVRGNLQQMDSGFRSLVAQYSKDSDLVSYNGHSGLGANIRAFTAMTRFTPGRYYLYWINACKPFAHLDSALFEGARQANPGAAASKYLDVMSVVNIGDFSSGGDVYQLVHGLLAKRNFHGLLYWLTSGEPSVLGEEDNAYPGPF
jgi:hypothetical protein